MRPKIIVFLMLIFPFHGHSFTQNSYFSKAVILKSDSTHMDGYVERIQESEISIQVDFIFSLEQKAPLRIPASQIERLIFTDDSTVFEKVPYVLPQKNGSEKVTEYRLAKKMLEGYADLYKMQLPLDEMDVIHEMSNTFIYLLKMDTVFYVLDLKEKWIEPSDVELKNRNTSGYNYMVINDYKKVLLSLFENNPKLTRRIKYLRLEDRDIVPLIKDFNASHPEIPQKTFLVKDRELISHGPVIGYTRLGEDDYWQGYELGYFIYIVTPQISERLSHQLGFSVINTSYSEGGEISGFGHIYKIPVSLRYLFFKGNISPFVGLGSSLYFIEYNFELRGMAGMFNVLAGATLLKRMDIAFKMESSSISIRREKSLTLNLGYRFGVQ
jgi:hypothetical protein